MNEVPMYRRGSAIFAWDATIPQMMLQYVRHTNTLSRWIYS